MELGNLVFGNSRGDVPVSRGLQDQFCALLDSLGVDSYGFPRDESAWSPAPVYGFTNGEFIVRSYCWGECDCGHEDSEWEWCEAHSHATDCYQTKRRALIDRFGAENFGRKPNRTRKEIARLCDEMGLSYPNGCAVHCTCSYKQEWHEWRSQNDHAETCSIAQPNFEHIPSGFKLSWYKYPLRDSYANKPLSSAMIAQWQVALAA